MYARMLAEFGEDVVLEHIQAEEARSASLERILTRSLGRALTGEEPSAPSPAHSSAVHGADLGFDLHNDERHNAAFDPELHLRGPSGQRSMPQHPPGTSAAEQKAKYPEGKAPRSSARAQCSRATKRNVA